jgi:hypothetical protein
MRPSLILLAAQAALLLTGAAVLPSYAASPDSDGVTVLTAPDPPSPAAASMEAVQVADGDTISAPAGMVITTTMDPRTSDYHTVVTAAGQ